MPTRTRCGGRQRVGAALDKIPSAPRSLAHGIDRVAEFDENAVVRALDDAPMMRGNGGVDQFAAEAANAARVLSSSRPASCSRRRRVTRVAATAQVSGFQGGG
jgi:hypothetical protein